MAPIRQISSNFDRNFPFPQFLHRNLQWIRLALDIYHHRRVHAAAFTDRGPREHRKSKRRTKVAAKYCSKRSSPTDRVPCAKGYKGRYPAFQSEDPFASAHAHIRGSAHATIPDWPSLCVTTLHVVHRLPSKPWATKPALHRNHRSPSSGNLKLITTLVDLGTKAHEPAYAPIITPLRNSNRSFALRTLPPTIMARGADKVTQYIKAEHIKHGENSSFVGRAIRFRLHFSSLRFLVKFEKKSGTALHNLPALRPSPKRTPSSLPLDRIVWTRYILPVISKEHEDYQT